MLSDRYMEGAAEIIVYKGIKFRRYPNSKNWTRRSYYFPNRKYTKQGVSSLHRELYKDYHGAIPDGYYVHHKDRNALNNDVTNLVAVNPSDHTKNHYIEGNWREKIGDWLRSDEGRKHNKKIAQSYWDNKQEKSYVCENCGKNFTSRSARENDVRACSPKCSGSLIRQSGRYNETRICAYCGNPFVCEKYRKKICCSRGCTNRKKEAVWILP